MYGLQSMLKDGHKHFSGLEEAVLKNIEACKGLAAITRTSMGPNGTGSSVGWIVPSVCHGALMPPPSRGDILSLAFIILS